MFSITIGVYNTTLGPIKHAIMADIFIIIILVFLAFCKYMKNSYVTDNKWPTVIFEKFTKTIL